jgi:hypothetical protein
MATIERTLRFINSIPTRFAELGEAMPRRLRKALARLDLNDPATFYDAGALARLPYHLNAHVWRRSFGVLV